MQGLALGLLFVLAPLAVAVEEPRWVEARVADASDRTYETTAIRLIDQAQRSIVFSCYVIRATGDARHPVDRLLHDLEEAAHRGVAVTVYPNFKVSGHTPEMLMAAPWVKRLSLAGVRVVPLAPFRRLHDKLLIVDERYILEGSSNWSIEALKNNWESNTLMDAPALAAVKLARLRARARRDGWPQAAPTATIPIPVALFAPGGALPRMAAATDERAFDTTLLLLREQTIQGAPAFFISLELLGEDLGLPAGWDDTTRRRQLIKVLRKLQARYQVLEVEFTHGGDARVTLRAVDGPTLQVPAAWLAGPTLAAERASATLARLRTPRASS